MTDFTIRMSTASSSWSNSAVRAHLKTHQLHKQVEHLDVPVQQLQVTSSLISHTSTMIELQSPGLKHNTIPGKPSHSSHPKEQSLSHISHGGDYTFHFSSSESEDSEEDYRSVSHRHQVPQSHEYDGTFRRQEKRNGHCHSCHRRLNPGGGQERFNSHSSSHESPKL